MKTATFARKTTAALAAMALALACIAVPAAFADQAQPNRGTACPSAVYDAQGQCQRFFVDEDGDGICDNRAGNCPAENRACDSTGAKHRGENAYGQGVGYTGGGQGKGHCPYARAN